MENCNYFSIDDLEIQYPIYLKINGRNWNFKSEYQKRLKSKSDNMDYRTLDLLIDMGVFDEIGKVYRNIPFLVTDDIRVSGDKRTYYLADYFIPEMNLVILLYNKAEVLIKTPKVRYLRDTLYNLGYDVIEITDLSSKNNLSEYLKGLINSISLREKPEVTILPKYFK